MMGGYGGKQPFVAVLPKKTPGVVPPQGAAVFIKEPGDPDDMNVFRDCKHG